MQPFAHSNAVSKQGDGSRTWVIPKSLARTFGGRRRGEAGRALRRRELDSGVGLRYPERQPWRVTPEPVCTRLLTLCQERSIPLAFTPMTTGDA